MQNNTTKQVTFRTAVTIVVANMVGAGVFTSLGYQALGTASVFPLLMLWVVGGVVAICGALSYGEMAALFPRSGGEYNYLSNTYHPAFGFLSGWISATVGFSAPVAMAAVALGSYASTIIALPPQVIAISVIVLISLIHATDVGIGSIFQQYSTAVKVVLIIGFIFGGLFFTQTPQPIQITPKEGDWTLIFSAGFAVNLAFVSFAYSGWNAAAYLANEIENPRINVPRALITGTLIVMVAYLLLNFVFLYTLPVDTYATEQLKNIKGNGRPLEVGYLSAQQFLGNAGAATMAGMIALLLVSSISAMIFAGPRVMQAMGEDIKSLNFLATKNKKGIPVLAIFIQSSISIILLLTAQFNTILYAIAFTLDIFTFSTVLGVFVMRFKAPKAERVYKTWGYPITPLIFLMATGWTMYYLLTDKDRTIPSLVALGVVLLGLVVYFINQLVEKNQTQVNK
ncbi:MAG: APC family permease [Cytophagia bacterium]|nr:MAG: APC family permease [Cytophagales bacterium]TAG07292.1 MAG: APC family permease [Cytophagia bacterium]TAG44522.1 MAG: APC family permease [Cytophagia bacterium]